MQISEDFLHFIWENQLAGRKFSLNSGVTCEILHPGKGGNKDGPDFEAALVIIDGLKLLGHIEIHVRSSEWYKHKHHLDSSYNKVILHVVAQNDEPVYDINENEIPVLVLDKKLLEEWKDKYEHIRMSLKSPFICAAYLSKIPEKTLKNGLEEMGKTRLKEKAGEIMKVFEESNQDWDECIYRILLKSYGLKQNTMPMEFLARSLPYKIIAKEKENLHSLEALFFGQAGILEAVDSSHSYIAALKKEYKYLKHKYNLNPINYNSWKYAPIRPAAMPDLRLAQLAAFFHNNGSLANQVLGFESKKDVYAWFNQETSVFWRNHYSLKGEESLNKHIRPGSSFIDLIIVNGIVPFYYFWADNTFQSQYINKALVLIEQCKSENNKIIHTFVKELQFAIQTALISQGIIHLFHKYCSNRNCLKCPFIKELMNLQGNHE